MTAAVKWIEDGLNATAFFLLRYARYLVALACVIALSIFGGLLVVIANCLFLFLLTCG